MNYISAVNNILKQIKAFIQAFWAMFWYCLSLLLINFYQSIDWNVFIKKCLFKGVNTGTHRRPIPTTPKLVIFKRNQM